MAVMIRSGAVSIHTHTHLIHPPPPHPLPCLVLSCPVLSRPAHPYPVGIVSRFTASSNRQKKSVSKCAGFWRPS